MTTMESWLLGVPVISIAMGLETASGVANELWNIQQLKTDNYVGLLDHLSRTQEKPEYPKKVLAKYGLLKKSPSKTIAKKITSEFLSDNNNVSLRELEEWSLILKEHNDRYVSPVPGMHPGKEAAKYKLDNLTYQLRGFENGKEQI